MSNKFSEEQVQELAELLEARLEQMLQHQKDRAIAAAREIRPNLTREDLLNPDDFKEVIASPHFMYEDGQAAGILSAKIAVRSLIRTLPER